MAILMLVSSIYTRPRNDQFANFANLVLYDACFLLLLAQFCMTELLQQLVVYFSSNNYEMDEYLWMF